MKKGLSALERVTITATAARRIIKSTFDKPLELSDTYPDQSSSMNNKEIPCKEALYDKTHLDRVIKCGFNRSLQSEIDKLDTNSLIQSPISEYNLKNVFLVGGKVFTSEQFYYFSDRSPIKCITKKMEFYEKATLLNSTQGLRYFGHWLRDDCAVYEKVRDRSPLISIARSDWPDSKFYEKAFDQTWNEVEFAYIKDLTFFRELGFNLDKAERLHLLRDKLRKSYSGNNAQKIVYISRGNLGDDRDMSNKEEVEKALLNAGIKVVVPASEGSSIIPELLDASMIISIEGSQLSHAVYSLADKGSLLVLQPPERFYNPHIEWARLLNVNYGIVIGEKDGSRFKINPNEVFKMIDALLSVS